MLQIFMKFYVSQHKNLQFSQCCKFKRSTYSNLATVLIASLIIALILTATLKARYYWHAHFTDDDTETNHFLKKPCGHKGSSWANIEVWLQSWCACPHTIGLLRFYSDIRKSIRRGKGYLNFYKFLWSGM